MASMASLISPEASRVARVWADWLARARASKVAFARSVAGVGGGGAGAEASAGRVVFASSGVGGAGGAAGGWPFGVGEAGGLGPVVWSLSALRCWLFLLIIQSFLLA